MFLYFTLFIIFMFGAFLDLTNVNRVKKAIVLFILGSICIVLSSIRWETGTDWLPYLQFFEINQTYEDFISGQFEWGYAFLNYFVKSITNQYNVFLFAMSIIVIGLKYKVIYAFSLFPLLSLCLNFANYNGDLFPVRQSIAIAIILWSTYYIIYRKIVFFIVTVLLASTFHISALVFLPAYYIFYLKCSRLILAFLTVIAIFVGNSNMTKDFLMYTLGLIDNEMVLKMIFYLEAEELNNNFGSALSNQTTIFMGVMRRCFFLAPLIYYKYKFQKISQQYSGFLNLNIVGICFYFFFSGLSTVLAGRGSVYYMIYEVFVIPYLILVVKNDLSNKIIFFTLFAVYCFLKYYNGLFMYYDEYVPFTSIFSI